MILISGPLGTILHTGDVRYNSSKMLKEIGLLIKFDNMIVDNTFCTPKEKFPSQAEAYEILRSKITKIHAEEPKLKFYIYCYTLGKEEVFINLAKEFTTRIMVDKDRWNRLEAIGMTDHFITQTEYNLELKRHQQLADEDHQDVFIYLKPMRDRPRTKEDIEMEKDVVHFTLTGWKG